MKVVIALGSNLGDSEALLHNAVKSLRDHISVEALSSFHRTAPVGGPEQPDYLNAVLIGRSDLAPHELLTLLHKIEADAGRQRLEHWGPRTLDLDLIAYGDVVIDSPALALPHPRAHERAFVLAPWSEIDPAAELVGKGAIADLLRQLQV